jgi:hypothetical protein
MPLQKQKTANSYLSHTDNTKFKSLLVAAEMKDAKRLKQSCHGPVSKMTPPKILGPLGHVRYSKDKASWKARTGGGNIEISAILGMVKHFLYEIGSRVMCVDFHPRYRLCDCLHQFQDDATTDMVATYLVQHYFCLNAIEQINFVSSDVRRNLEKSVHSSTEKTLSTLDRIYTIQSSSKIKLQPMCIYGYLWIFHVRKFNYKNYISKIEVGINNLPQHNLPSSQLPAVHPDKLQIRAIGKVNGVKIIGSEKFVPLIVRVHELNDYGKMTRHVARQMTPIKKNGDVSIEYNFGDKPRIINVSTTIKGTYQFEIHSDNLPRNKDNFYRYWIRLNDKSSQLFYVVVNSIAARSEANYLTRKFSLSSNIYARDYRPYQSKAGSYQHHDQSPQKRKKVCQKNQVACKNSQFLDYNDVSKHFITNCELGVSDERNYGIVFNKKHSSIPKGSIIGEYCGEIVSKQDIQKREQEWKDEGNKGYYGAYLLSLDDPLRNLAYDEDSKWYIDARNKGNLTRYINHSCNPNCEYKTVWIDGHIRAFVVAIEKITNRTELTTRYCKKKDLPFDCKCITCEQYKMK